MLLQYKRSCAQQLMNPGLRTYHGVPCYDLCPVNFCVRNSKTKYAPKAKQRQNYKYVLCYFSESHEQIVHIYILV